MNLCRSGTARQKRDNIMSTDIRWQQRFENYCRALLQLKEAVELLELRELSNIEKQGFIKAFEFTHELAWNVLKDFSIYQGDQTVTGSRDATRWAFKNGLIENGDTWMEMIITRNKAVHTYNAATVADVISRTKENYYPLFLDLETTMKRIIHEQ